MNGDPQADSGKTSPPVPSRATALGAAGVAVIALLLLLDAAVETFRAGSPLRWWASPSAVVFVGLSIWLWKPGESAARRWGWPGAASWSWGGLLLLIAATAWLPEGQTSGVRLLGQPTAAVLTTVAAVAALLAALVLFRASELLPRTARLVSQGIVIALAAYVLVSFALALRDGAPFATLFQGGAAWQRLPRWLQGAFVGVFALLPLALLGQVMRVVDHLRRKQPIRVLLHQATALVMSVVMAVPGALLQAPGGVAGRTEAPGATSGQRPASAPAAAPEELVAAAPVPLAALQSQWIEGQDPVAFVERLLTTAEAELRKPGADPSDVKAMAASLGRDPQKIFAFLRDQIITEPYVGMLRGARGTLAAGAGNALDRALLAQALLKASGVEGRLVAGVLPSERAQTLLNLYLAADPLKGPLASSAETPDGATLDVNAKEAASRIGLSPDKAQGIARRAAAQAESFWRTTDERRRTQTDFLAGQLQRAGVKAATDAGLSAAVLQERLTKHYWVQVRDASGAWTEFDPSLPDAQPGTTSAAGAAPIGDVPRDAVHRFTISLVYHSKAGTAEKHEVLLKGEVASADALFTPMAFQIQPAEPTPDVGALAGMAAAEKAGVLKRLKRFQGMLQVGSRVTPGRVFDVEGNTYGTAPDSQPRTGAADLMSGFFRGEDSKAAAPAQFTALELVLGVTGPGRRPLAQTRTLVRAEDVKAPNFAPPLFWSEILVQPQWIPPDLLTYQTLQSLVAARGVLTDAIAASRDGRSVRVPPPSMPSFPQHLLPLTLLRQRAAAGILHAQPGVRALVDAPLLTMANQQLQALDAETGVLRFRRSIDIVTNAVSFVGQDGSTGQAAYDVALRVGVADSTLESQFLQQCYPEDVTVSGANVFERAQREGRPVAVVGARDGGALRRAGLGEPDIEWIRQNEEPAGRVVVTTTAAGSAAWWSVGPDGTSTLRVSGGWGQGLTEHEAIILKVVAGAYCGWEVKHWASHPTAARSWGAASCLVLSTVSATFAFVGIHGVALGLLFAVEILNVVGTSIAVDSERVRVIDLRGRK